MNILMRQRGFTLIEILVAMIILSIGLLGIAGLTVGIIQGNAYSKNVTTATVIAEGRLEDIRRAGYVNTGTFSAGPDAVSMGGVSFSRTTSITYYNFINNNCLPSNPASNMKCVTVAVSWGNGARSTTLNTFLAQ